MVHLEEPLSRSIFVLRPFQKKNPREKTKVSPRCARRQAKRRRKNKRKSFLIFVSSDQKPQKGVFSLNLAANQGARSARKIFRVFSASEASMLKKSARNFPTEDPQKHSKNSHLSGKNSGPETILEDY